MYLNIKYYNNYYLIMGATISYIKNICTTYNDHLNHYDNLDTSDLAGSFNNEYYDEYYGYLFDNNSGSINKKLLEIVESCKYYQLFIYLDPELSDEIKQMYIDSCQKHNSAIDNYFNSLHIESCNDSPCFDAGFDLFSPTETISYGTQSLVLDHKIKCSMKCNNRYVGYYLYLRSSTASKTPLRLSNSVGVIDSGYRGNIIAMFDNVKDYDFMEYQVTFGNRYVQICPPNIEYPMKVYIVDSVDDLGKKTSRGDGGIGSTGN